MNRDPGNWLRYLAAHLAAGTLAALVFIAALLATDTAGVAGLAFADRQGGWALVLLAFGIWATFGGVAVGVGIMSIDRRADHRPLTPRSGHAAAGFAPAAAGRRVRSRSGSRSSR